MCTGRERRRVVDSHALIPSIHFFTKIQKTSVFRAKVKLNQEICSIGLNFVATVAKLSDRTFLFFKCIAII